MTKYKKIKSDAQYNLFSAVEKAEQEVIGDFEVILPKREEKKPEVKTADEVEGFGAVVTEPERKPLYFMSFGSGSSGNCIYVGSDTTHLLVDTGISKKRTEEGLHEIGVSLQDMDGILIIRNHVTVCVETTRQLLGRKSVMEEKDVITQHAIAVQDGGVMVQVDVQRCVGMG